MHYGAAQPIFEIDGYAVAVDALVLRGGEGVVDGFSVTA